MSTTIKKVSTKSIEQLKTPPHSIEAEQSILGGLMMAPEAWEQIADKVFVEDFYIKSHRIIFEAIYALLNQDKACDAVTVNEYLTLNDQTEEAGDLAYLVELVNNTPSVANIVAYAEIVRERSVLRQLIQTGHDIASSAYQPEGRGSQELLETAEKQVFSIAEQGVRARSGFIPIEDSLKSAFQRIDELYHAEGSITGVPTGFMDFDDATSGLQRSDLIIVAGRPSMGKTSFAMNIAETAAIKHKTPIAIFSMEMSSLQLITRMIASLGRINQLKLRNGRLDDEDWPRVTSAMGLLRETKIFIDETPSLSPNEVRARARRLKRSHDIGLIIIDYMQLMQIPGNSENRATEISEISRNLKALAKELDVPVVALSQLNRSLEQRPNKRPIMADLRESGAIEQDADVIVFIYRDEVYDKESKDKGKAEIIIGKQRNGATPTVMLTFQGQFTRFDNFSSGF